MNTANSEQLWALTILPVGSSIRQAVQAINGTSLKIVMDVDASNRLVGTISAGDIRGGLLKGLELTSEIDSIVHENKLVVPPALSPAVVF